MDRRRSLVLIGSGMLSLAGFAGSGHGIEARHRGTPVPPGANTPRKRGTRPGQPTPEEPTPTPEEPTPTEPTQTPTEPTAELVGEGSGDATLEITAHELVAGGAGFGADAYVEATVENVGDAASGDVEIAVDWYDDDGDYLGNAREFLRTLGAGETWAVRLPFFGSEDVADYDVGGSYQRGARDFDVDGLELLASEMELTDVQAIITGRVQNDTGQAQGYLEAIGKVYDADGLVLGDAWTNVTDVPAGEVWAFRTTWFAGDRTGEAADHAVLVTNTVR